MSGIETSRELHRYRPALKILIMTGADLSSVELHYGWLYSESHLSERLPEAVSTILNSEMVAMHHA